MNAVAAQVEAVEHEILDLPIQVRRAGQGSPVVILHSDIGCDGWPEFNQLIAQGHEVVAPVLPGFDGTPRAAWMRDVNQLAAVIGLLLDRLDLDSPTLLGLGFGGWVAAEVAVYSPSRAGALVLQSPMGIKPPQGEILDQFLFPLSEYVRRGFTTDEAFTATFGAEPDFDTGRRWDGNREMATRIAWRPYMYSKALPHLLPAIDLPTLIVSPEQDGIVPASAARRYTELIPGSKSVELPATGHHVSLEAPEQLARAVTEFLSEPNAEEGR